MRKIFGLLLRPIEKIMNKLQLKHKFFVLYFLCVVVPLVITDSIVLRAVYIQEINSIKYDMEYVGAVYRNYFNNLIDGDVRLSNSISMNNKMREFLDTDFESDYDYYSQYFDIINDSFLETTLGLDRDSLVIYADNKGILDSMFIKKLSGAYSDTWYKEFIESGQKEAVIAYYDDTINSSIGEKRKFLYVKRINTKRSGCAKLVVIGHDSSSMESDLKAFTTKYPVYVIYKDYVVFSTEGQSIVSTESIDLSGKNNVVQHMRLADSTLKIVVVNDESLIATVVKDNIGIIVTLLLITIIIPLVVLRSIENTIVSRIHTLENAFGSEKTNTFTSIGKIDGTDEIASLMQKYNKMVDITNELITTVYTNKIKEQESDIARQKAELLALQSQINPHFMFNALESIRMHSLLKGENETAIMVDKLAIMERQNVEWGRDYVTIKKEIESIEAYLALQGYRFGERLSYNIDIEDGCEEYKVPKLTVVTFVENACVHGIESKSSPGWIFVRVYKNRTHLFIEIEDTGEGMSEEEVATMIDNINNVSIETIKGKKHVGILNACLRLKMVTNNEVSFSIESEPGVGLSVIIKIPLKKLSDIEEKDNA